MATAQKTIDSMQRLKEGFAAVRSLAGLFRLRASSDPQRIAALRKTGGAWKPLTWAELGGLAEDAAWALIASGVKPEDRVSLVGSTRVEWTVADLGIAHAGAVSVPIYQSDTAEEIRYVVQNSGATVVFVEDDKQLRKLREVRSQLPAVRCCVLIEGEGDGDWALSFAQLVARGKEHKARVPGELQQRLEQQRLDQLSTILYTSGTTGTPKGVMITNDQFIFAAEALVGTGLLVRDDRHLLFLPFSHAFAQTIKAAWFASGLEMIYAESWDRLVDNAGETGPTVISGVPRVYEKAFSSVVGSGVAQEGPPGTLFRTAMQEFELYADAKEKGQAYSSSAFELARKLVFPEVRQKLSQRFGGRIRAFVSGGAPLSHKIACFFDLLGFNLLEGYGLTETLGITSVNLPGQKKLGTVGRPFPGVEVKIAEDGEILERGRQIMRGYLGMPEATSEVMDRDDWFHGGRRPAQVRVGTRHGGGGPGEEGGGRRGRAGGDLSRRGDLEGGPGQSAGSRRTAQRDSSLFRDGEALHHPRARVIARVRRIDAQPQSEAQDRNRGIQAPDRRDVRRRILRLAKLTDSNEEGNTYDGN